jgi:SAM-dependent methyltransferase
VRQISTTSEYTLRDQERMRLAPNYFQWQARIVTRHLGSRVLEIGSGMGNFTRCLLDRQQVIAIDKDESCILRLVERFGEHPNLIARPMDVLDPSFLEWKHYNLDSVVMLNVLEHIADDARALQHAHAVLPKGGNLILLLPAFESLYGPIDANLGHYRRYSKGSIRRLVESQGFRVRRLRYFNSVGWFGWWVNARISRKTEQSEEQIRFFDSRIVPLLSRLEAAIEPPIGQSLFAVLEKAG